MSETGLGPVTFRPAASFAAPHQEVVAQEKSSTFFDKYLYPSLLKRNLHYRPSTSGSFMGRAIYATSHILITRDDSGSGRLNTSYLVAVLTSVAAHAAYRPYGRRSASDAFNNFGSTLGSDAGLNLFHEFGPGIRQMAKGHTPKFVFKIEGRITHRPDPRQIVPTPAR